MCISKLKQRDSCQALNLRCRRERMAGGSLHIHSHKLDHSESKMNGEGPYWVTLV